MHNDQHARRNETNQLLLLLEMLSPDRYPEALISTQPFAETSTDSMDAPLTRGLEQEAEQVRDQAASTRV